MSKPIMISLIAVLLMIIVIGFAAMRFLRAEDDPFEGPADDPAWQNRQRGRTRLGRTGHPPAPTRTMQEARTASGKRAHDASSPGEVLTALGKPELVAVGGRAGQVGRDRGPARPVARSADSRLANDARPGISRTGQRGPGTATVPRPPRDRAAAGGSAGAASARQGSRARAVADHSDWSPDDWDSLSDVDYWAELAADKPLAGEPSSGLPAANGRERRRRGRLPARRTPAPGSPAAPAAASAPSAAHAARDEAVRSGRAPQRIAGRATNPPPAAPERGAARHPGRAARPSALPLIPPEHPSVPMGDPRDPRDVVDPPREPYRSRGSGSPGRADYHPARASKPIPADDDPLTSPSFPRIADDGRSYRSARTEGQASVRYRGEPGSFPTERPPARPATGVRHEPAARGGDPLSSRHPSLAWPGSPDQPSAAPVAPHIYDSLTSTQSTGYLGPVSWPPSSSGRHHTHEQPRFDSGWYDQSGSPSLPSDYAPRPYPVAAADDSPADPHRHPAAPFTEPIPPNGRYPGGSTG